VSEKKRKEAAAVVYWEGDSLEVVKKFPEMIRRKLGEDLRRIQLGEKPLDSKTMKSIGPKVSELRQADKNGWYRTIYYGVVDDSIHVLHSFIKKSGKTPKNDLAVAKTRLKEVRARQATEKKKLRNSKEK